MGYSSEVILTKDNISEEEWLKLIKLIFKYNGLFHKWSLLINIENKQIRFFIQTKYQLPPILNDLSAFLFKEEQAPVIGEYSVSLPAFLGLENNIFDLYNHYEIKKTSFLKYIKITFLYVSEDKNISLTHLFIQKNNTLLCKRLIFGFPLTLLNLDFAKNKSFFKKGSPKYFDISKIMPLLSQDKTDSLLKVDTFPYMKGSFYLSEMQYDFAKHSLVIGASGCGKSKFLSHFISDIKKKYGSSYKVVMIDPHAAIEQDIGGLGKVIDFNTLEDTIDLFATSSKEIVASTELTLDLFKSLIGPQYNAKLERVLRHSIYLLLVNQSFNFVNLKNLLIETEYRNMLIRELKDRVPFSIISFFLNDFNDIKTKSYGEAISPLIAFIDEVEMIPVFNEPHITNTLESTIKNNYLTLFSLDRTILGDKVTKTIAGLIMQQLLTIIQSHVIKEHIIFIVDEVAVVQNNFLERYLSEARKYNLSIILATQYFNQISPSLRESIYANIINYYIFRVSKNDANLLVTNLDIKLANDNDFDAKVKLLSSLNNREVLVRISSKEMLLPAFKARTLDFTSLPRLLEKTSPSKEIKTEEQNLSPFNFNISSKIKLNDILKLNSTSRKINK